MEESIIYDCRWSDALDAKFVRDFRNMCSTVFNYDFTDYEFNRKFIDNPYGKSVLVVVYLDGKPCAARALWRNDINGKESYQPGDTCVLEICRGKGIFPEMTRRAIAMLPKDAIIYNFPNQNSVKGYLNMGWSLLHDYHMNLFTTYKTYKKEHPYAMDDEFADWWIKGRQLLYIKRDGYYFLIAKHSRRFCYRVIAEVSEKTATQFPRKRLGIMFYLGDKVCWYNKRFASNHVVTKNPEIGYIPTWKIDAV